MVRVTEPPHLTTPRTIAIDIHDHKAPIHTATPCCRTPHNRSEAETPTMDARKEYEHKYCDADATEVTA